MIKTSEVKNKTELSRKIINQFLKDDILLNNEKFDFFYDNLNKSWKAKGRTTPIYINRKGIINFIAQI